MGLENAWTTDGKCRVCKRIADNRYHNSPKGRKSKTRYYRKHYYATTPKERIYERTKKVGNNASL